MVPHLPLRFGVLPPLQAAVVHSARNAAATTSTATHGTTPQRPRDAAPSAPCRGPPLCGWLSWSLISRSAPRRRGVSRSAPWASTRRSRRLSPLRLEAALTSVRLRREARRCPRSLRQRGRGRHQAGCRPHVAVVVSRSAPWASTRRSRRLSPLRLEAALTSVRSRREARRCPRSLRQRGRGRHQAGCRPKRRFGGLLACDLRFLYL